MKCPRCKHEMKREKTKQHSYRYKCSHCGLIVGNSKDTTNEYKEAYEIVSGVADSEQ